MKHTINRAELMAVIVVVKQFGTLNRRIAVAMDSEYVYSRLQGAAARWKHNGWVYATGPVSNTDLWI
jgi:ribonuclease HI